MLYFKKCELIQNQTHKRIASLFFLFLFSTSVSALTESEFVQKLLSNPTFFEKEHINLTIKQIEMEGDRANYADWKWVVGGEVARIEKSKNKVDYTSTDDYAKHTSQQVRKFYSDLTKHFFADGSKLKISYDKSYPVKDEEWYDKNGYQGDSTSTEYIDDLSISWELPLLKNQGGIIDQKTYDLAVLEYADEKLVLAEVKENFIEKKLIVFIDWARYKAEVEVVSDRLKISENIFAILQKQDISKARMSTLQKSINKARRLLLSVQSRLEVKQRELKTVLIDFDLDANPLEVNWNTRVQPIQDLHQYFTESVRAIKRIEIEQLKNKRSIKAYKNADLGDLDFVISARREDKKGSYSTYTKSSEIIFEAKLKLYYPLTGNINNQVDLNKYRLKTRQLELKYKDKFDDLLADAQRLTTELKQGLKQLDLYRKRKYSRERTVDHVELELKALLAGVGHIRFLINEQEERQALLLDRIEIDADYQKNRIRYNGLMDRLLNPLHSL